MGNKQHWNNIERSFNMAKEDLNFPLQKNDVALVKEQVSCVMRHMNLALSYLETIGDTDENNS